jgi:hypothetical protein
MVYTAIFGNYDDVKKQPVEVKVVNEESGWYPKDLHPRLQAKYFKCNSHLLETEYSIWVDGSATIHDPQFIQRCLDYLGKSDLMCFVHPEGRRCIYQEAEYCKNMPKYKDVDIQGQVDAYRQQGYPELNGLWACGLVVRRHTPKVEEFNKLWWEHNLKYTYQDQLSFPVVLRETGVNFKTLWLNQHDNDLITFMTPHKHEY